MQEVKAKDVPVRFAIWNLWKYKDYLRCCRSAVGGCDEMWYRVIGTWRTIGSTPAD